MNFRPHYFNTGHVAFPTTICRRALQEWIWLIAEIGSDSPEALTLLERGDFSILSTKHLDGTRSLSAHWEGLETLYLRLAELVSCDPKKIAILPTFMGSLLLALRAFDNIGFSSLFYTDLDHPNVIGGIKSFGNTFGIVPTEISIEHELLRTGDIAAVEQRLIKTLNRASRAVLFMPHVDYRYGFTLDVHKVFKNLNHSNALLVDAVHSIGQIDVAPFDGRGTAIVLGSGHKWLGGWRASSFVYGAGASDDLEAIVKFWTSQTHTAFSMYDRLDPLTRYADWGSVCEMPLISLGIGLRQIANFGIANIVDHVRTLSNYLEDLNTSTSWSIIGRNHSNGIRFLSPKRTLNIPEIVSLFRTEYQLALSGYNTPTNGLRICISQHNSASDMEKLFSALKSVL